MATAPESAGPYQIDLQTAEHYIHYLHKIPCEYSRTLRECLKKPRYDDLFGRAIPPAPSCLYKGVQGVEAVSIR